MRSIQDDGSLGLGSLLTIRRLDIQDDFIVRSDGLGVDDEDQDDQDDHDDDIRSTDFSDNLVLSVVRPGEGYFLPASEGQVILASDWSILLILSSDWSGRVDAEDVRGHGQPDLRLLDLPDIRDHDGLPPDRGQCDDVPPGLQAQHHGHHVQGERPILLQVWN